MTTDSDSNQRLLHKQVATVLGRPYPIRPNRTILTVAVTDNSITVQSDVYETTEGVREIRFSRHGMRLEAWTRPDAHSPWKYDCITAWDEDFTPFYERRVGHSQTLAEYRARREWEGMQYRVGTAKSPMDNADRSSDPSAPMHDYWMHP